MELLQDAFRRPRVCAIAAFGTDRALGMGLELLWPIPDDLRRFRRLTTGCPIIMGRKTFDTLGRPLPNRHNIVLTRNKSWSAPGVVTVYSVSEAMAEACGFDPKPERIFVIGGGEVYTAMLELTDELYLTLIDGQKPGDSFFPEYERLFPTILPQEESERGERVHEGVRYRWVNLSR